MKRDMDTVRQLLLAVEAQPAGEPLIEFYDLDWQSFAEYARWLQSGGLIDAELHDTNAGTSAEITRLTWEGCEMLDAMRSDTLWAKAKESILKPGASFTLDVLKDWLKSEVRDGFPNLKGLVG
jgi:Hypothetical protein (DUF2513)